jgi:ATP-dependent helicase HrpA
MVRIEKLRTNLARDQDNQVQWTKLHRQYTQMLNNQHIGDSSRQLKEIRWQLEELRVALYAQELKTPTPMSIKRVEKILNSIRG